MRVLVTGGAGLIGSHLADMLYEKGYQVRIFDNLEKGTHIKKVKWLRKEYEFVKGDIKNKKAVENALKGIDIVFHLAAYGGFAPDVTKFVYANSVGTANIYDVIREKKLKVQKIVVASSQGVYGEGKYKCLIHGFIEPPTRPLEQLERGEWELRCPECGKILVPFPTDEGKRIDPGIVYSITKYEEERIALKVGQRMGIPTVALRYAITYGPRQSLINPYTGITSIFSTRILNNIPLKIYEDGNQKRDFIYVEDVARANILVSEKQEADYEVFNVGTSKPTTMLEFVDILNDAYGTDIKPHLTGEFRPGEVRHLFLDSTKLRSLGWEPQVKLIDGIKNYVAWIRQQGNIKEYFERAYEIMKQRGFFKKN